MTEDEMRKLQIGILVSALDEALKRAEAAELKLAALEACLRAAQPHLSMTGKTPGPLPPEVTT